MIYKTAMFLWQRGYVPTSVPQFPNHTLSECLFFIHIEMRNTNRLEFSKTRQKVSKR